MIASAFAIGALSLVGGGSAVAAGSPHATHVFSPLLERLSSKHFAQPPTTKECIQSIGIACYAPAQIRKAYDINPLYKLGLDGSGKTIVIVDSFGSPTIQADLAQFDADFGIPAPPSFQVITPVGAPPPFDPNNSTMVGWAFETSLDVEWAHAIAPGANILLVETPDAETEGVTGFPSIVAAEKYVLDNQLGDVISQSFGATERTFTAKQIDTLRTVYGQAAAQNVSVLASSGDQGPTSYHKSGQTLYTTRTIIWPGSDPLVTSFGGTQLHLDRKGVRTAPDNAWNDSKLFGGPAATGGGKSIFFSRPSYQDSVQKQVGPFRGIPDVSLSAAVDGGALVYLSFLGPTNAGYYVVGGTSWSSPMGAGMIAIADQAGGSDLGLINPALYAAASAGNPGIVDVTLGDNTVRFAQGGGTFTVRGFPAVAGYDGSTGLGTIDLYLLLTSPGFLHP